MVVRGFRREGLQVVSDGNTVSTRKDERYWEMDGCDGSTTV